ncbi:MAG: repair protein RadC [Clostridiales bacterium]|nr:repair protein RadC [Clostridiales bacterium]
MNEKHLKTKDLPMSERPYEKLMKLGASHLSDAELLAVIIRTGTKKERAAEVALRILSLHAQENGLLGVFHLTLPELTQIEGIGCVKALQILAVVELSKRMAKASAKGGLYFTTPESIATAYMQEMRGLSVEKVKLLLLNAKSKLIKEMDISMGTATASLLSPREILIEALRYQAIHMILIHNHPSGDPEPSNADVLITKRIEEAGTLLGIKLMDHIIIGDNRYISLKKKGIL